VYTGSIVEVILNLVIYSCFAGYFRFRWPPQVRYATCGNELASPTIIRYVTTFRSE